MIVVPNIWGQLPTFNTLVPALDLFNFGHSLVHGNVIYLFMTGKIADYGIVYTAVLITLIMSFTSAAYVVTKTIDAAINYTLAGIVEYAYIYRGGSVAWGDNLGLFELVAIIFFEAWSLALTIISLYYAFMLWDMVDKRLVDVKTEGTGGIPVDFMAAMKFLVVCFIIGITQMIAAFSLGDVASLLITWFDQYADNTN